jgi:hypothetical protein
MIQGRQLNRPCISSKLEKNVTKVGEGGGSVKQAVIERKDMDI